jgi:hypothetical protein
VLTPTRPAPRAGDDTRHGADALAQQRLAPGLHIPKNRSTGNLGAMGDNSEKARIRFSFDAGAAAAEYDALSRSASSMEPHCPCPCQCPTARLPIPPPLARAGRLGLAAERPEDSSLKY